MSFQRHSLRYLVPAALVLGLGAYGCSHHNTGTQSATKTPTVASSRAVAKPAMPSKAVASTAKTSNENWIMGENNRYIPVIGELEQHLFQAQSAENAHNMTLVATQLRMAAAQLPPRGATLNTAAMNELAAAGKALNAAANDAAAGRLQAATLGQDITNAYDASLRNGLPGMQEKQWADTYQQPLAHLTSARAVQAGNPKMAAAQLGQANAYLAVYAARAKGVSLAALHAASRDIATLAAQLADGKSQSIDDTNRLIGSVGHTLAQFDFQNAKDSWQLHHDPAMTANWLVASLHNQREAIAIPGRTIQPSDANALASSQQFATGIEKNPKVDDREMNQQLDQVETEMRKLSASTAMVHKNSSKLASLSHPHK